MAHTLNCSTQEANTEVKARLLYRVSSKRARATQRILFHKTRKWGEGVKERARASSGKRASWP